MSPNLIRILIFVGIVAAGPATAATPAQCNQYADAAVAAAQEYAVMKCGASASRYSADRAGHYRWCLSASESAVSKEAAARERGVAACVSSTRALRSPPQQPETVPLQSVRINPAVAEISTCRSRCKEGVFELRQLRSDNLVCETSVKQSCGQYGCADNGEHCNVSCTGDGDCASGAMCDKTSSRCIFPECPGAGTCLGYFTPFFSHNYLGECKMSSLTNCWPMACVDGSGCNTTCTSDRDCAAGATCDIAAAVCVPESGGTCADEFTAEAPDGTKMSCAPYRCVNGACRDSCAQKADCSVDHGCFKGWCRAISAGDQTCSADSECDSGDYCDRGVCEPK